MYLIAHVVMKAQLLMHANKRRPVITTCACEYSTAAAGGNSESMHTLEFRACQTYARVMGAKH